MSASYRAFIAADVIATLRGLRRSEQELLTHVFDDLANDPFRRGDYVERDDLGRPIQVLLAGRFAVFYWADHPVKELKVTDLKPAGR